ncbi:uncharacterized protein BDV14DRAFT_206370 [Aspergillus stella-maris]|uniref:uncharacterized protein n=1 Tax=Aspergillus stella-maris TaxID=1810926 RepID=UPI003CCD752E
MYKLLLPAALLALSATATAEPQDFITEVDVTAISPTTSIDIGSVTTLPGTSEDWTATLPVETPSSSSSSSSSSTASIETDETPTGTFTILPIDVPTDAPILTAPATDTATATHPIGSETPPWWATPGPSGIPTGSTLFPSSSFPSGTPTGSDAPVFTGGAAVLNARGFWAVVGMVMGVVVVV